MKFQDDISKPPPPHTHTHKHTHGQAETNMSPTCSKLGGIIMHTPVNPTFTILKRVVRGSSLHGLVFVMKFSKPRWAAAIGAELVHRNAYDCIT